MSMLSRNLTGRAIVVLVMMVAASVLANRMTPRLRVADFTAGKDYSQVIPTEFGNWVVDVRVGAGIVNPQSQELLSKLYRQVVTRTYLNTKSGEKIMLSVAYGDVQSKESQIHLPEVCYPSQGFAIDASRKVTIRANGLSIPATRLVAKGANRIEPITYWIRLGDRVVQGGFEQKIETIREGLSGRIPDGLLFRVSSIEVDPRTAYRSQDHFITDLLKNLDADALRLVVGLLSRTDK